MKYKIFNKEGFVYETDNLQLAKSVAKENKGQVYEWISYHY